MKKFDVSWKFIVLTIIVLAFLLSAIDMVSHGQTIENEELFVSRWEKVQQMEDRYEKILMEEGEEDVPYIFINGIFRVFTRSEYSTYSYVSYIDDQETCRGFKTLPNRFVDIMYSYRNMNDTEWLKNYIRLKELFDIR